MRALIVVLLMLMPGADALAQVVPDRVHVAVDVAPDCADARAAATFTGEVRQRLPDLRVTATSGANAGADVRVAWTRGPGGCVVEVRDATTVSTVSLAAQAADGAIVDVASRVAWLAEAAAANVDAEAEEPAPDEEEPPAAVVEEAEEPASPAPAPALPAVAFGMSLWPGTNIPASAGEGVVRRTSFNLFGGRSGGLRGFELGLVFNDVRGDARGLQIGGVANLVEGHVTGLQVAPAFNRSGGDLVGAQVGVVNVAGGATTGAQFGFVNVARGELVGVQHGTVNVARARLTGAQLGNLNLAEDISGAQIGMVNHARDVSGAQVGFINVADTSSVSIGLVNVMRHEPVYGLLWVDSDGFARAGLQHGSRAFRNVLAAGVRPVGATRRWSVGGGWSGHIPLRRLYLELDLLAHLQGAMGQAPRVTVTEADGQPTRVTVSRLDGLVQARAVLGLPFDRFAVYVGVTQNALFTQDGEHDQPWGNATPIDLGGTSPTYVFLYPSFLAGVRF